MYFLRGVRWSKNFFSSRFSLSELDSLPLPGFFFGLSLRMESGFLGGIRGSPRWSFFSRSSGSSLLGDSGSLSLVRDFFCFHHGSIEILHSKLLGEEQLRSMAGQGVYLVSVARRGAHLLEIVESVCDFLFCVFLVSLRSGKRTWKLQAGSTELEHGNEAASSIATFRLGCYSGAPFSHLGARFCCECAVAKSLKRNFTGP